MQTPDNLFKQALARGEVQIGLWQALADPYAAELCAGSGFEWMLFDGEHAPNDLRSLLGALQSVAAYPTHPVVRAAIDHAIGRILKAGKAPGILCADETLARHYMALGARFVAVGGDTSMLVRATAALAAQYKQAAPVATSSGAY